VIRLTNDIPDPFQKPEDYEKYVQAENENIKAQVAADQLRRREERQRILQNQQIMQKVETETRERKRKELIAEQTYGMDKAQIKWYDRLMTLQGLIERSSGDQRSDYQAESAILMEKMLSKGRVVGVVDFTPVSILVSNHGLIDNNARYHSGVLGSYESTTLSLEYDKEDKNWYLVKMSNISHTNLLIKDKILVHIIDKLQETKANPIQGDLFPRKQELPPARPATKAETEKKCKGLFR